MLDAGIRVEREMGGVGTVHGHHMRQAFGTMNGVVIGGDTQSGRRLDLERGVPRIGDRDLVGLKRNPDNRRPHLLWPLEAGQDLAGGLRRRGSCQQGKRAKQCVKKGTRHT